MPAFVIVCCPIRSAHGILIGGTSFKTLTASVMRTVRLAHSKTCTVHSKAGIEICNKKKWFNDFFQCQRLALLSKNHEL